MELSERGLQRKQLNADFRRILLERQPLISTNFSTGELHSSLKDLSSELCSVYLSYPLLCGRFVADNEDPDPSSEEEHEAGSRTAYSSLISQFSTPDPNHQCSFDDLSQTNACEEQGHTLGECFKDTSALEHHDDDDVTKGTTSNSVVKTKKKPRSRKQKHNPIKQQLRMGMTIKEIQKGGAMNVPESAGSQGFARALAVCYNTKTQTLTCGLSGKLRKVRVHPLIWGKSVEPGRPRGTCAEFKVVNQALLADEDIGDLILNVVDIKSGQPKPRCRNCELVTGPARVLSDSL